MRRIYQSMLTAAACAALLSGCETQPTQDDNALANEWQAAVEQTDACVATAKNTDVYLRLSERIVLFPGEDQRAAAKTQIQDGITSQEKEDLLAWLPMVDQCRNIRLAAARRLFPTIGNVLAEGQSDVDTLFGYLTSGQLSVGDFNARFIQENAKVLADLRAAQAQLNATPQAAP